MPTQARCHPGIIGGSVPPAVRRALKPGEMPHVSDVWEPHRSIFDAQCRLIGRIDKALAALRRRRFGPNQQGLGPRARRYAGDVARITARAAASGRRQAFFQGALDEHAMWDKIRLLRERDR